MHQCASCLYLNFLFRWDHCWSLLQFGVNSFLSRINFAQKSIGRRDGWWFESAIIAIIIINEASSYPISYSNDYAVFVVVPRWGPPYLLLCLINRKGVLNHYLGIIVFNLGCLLYNDFDRCSKIIPTLRNAIGGSGFLHINLNRD